MAIAELVDVKFFPSQGLPGLAFPGVGTVGGIVQIGIGAGQSLGLVDVRGKRISNPLKLIIPEPQEVENVEPLSPVSTIPGLPPLGPILPVGAEPPEPPTYEFAIETVMNVSESNDIVMQTPVQGEGTIKEYWAFNDYQIRISGVLVAGLTRAGVFTALRENLKGNADFSLETIRPPTDKDLEEKLNDEIVRLQRFLKYQRELRVESTYLNQRYGIDHIAVLSVQFPHPPNTPNTCLLYTSPSPRDS